jgi:hypothetical protein
LIGHISKDQQKKWEAGELSDWAEESFQIAKDDAYGELPAPNARGQGEGRAGKLLGSLIEIAPGVKRVAIMFNSDTAADGESYFLPSFESSARSLKVEPIIARVRSESEIETIMASLGRGPGVGLIVMPDIFVDVHRATVISSHIAGSAK